MYGKQTWVHFVENQESHTRVHAFLRVCFVFVNSHPGMFSIDF